MGPYSQLGNVIYPLISHPCGTALEQASLPIRSDGTYSQEGYELERLRAASMSPGLLPPPEPRSSTWWPLSTLTEPSARTPDILSHTSYT